MATSLGDVAIVGAGQVGTMLGMALMAGRHARGAGVRRVTLHDVDGRAARESLARGAGDEIGRPGAEPFAADTVVLATPVPEIVRMLDEYGDRTRPGALVIDTGSTKRAVVKAMRRRVPPGAHAVGGHPMAGTERAGPPGAMPELLAGATFVLTPARIDPSGMARARAFVEAVGARPVEVDADDHDRAAAYTSHLPQLIASALSLTVGGRDMDAAGRWRRAGSGSAPDPVLVEAMVASGYLGASRLATSGAASTAAYLRSNRDNLRGAVDLFRHRLSELVALLDEPARLEAALAEGAAARREVAGSDAAANGAAGGGGFPAKDVPGARRPGSGPA
jgi:prephenate dehydrogenase